ncbi:Two component regulator propeller [Chitinophaga costaii]|uniref:Two component regulator propeller n=1 Tax=Chitinophaga costaii TaxID=1335309 RepID=A0A1C4ES32_9BACT|nr:sensor histidine kinase [Chitinophaga costaii]PUZ22559.1 hypothetical protein DCM91_14930 [Chitinophaga costaii]SCC46458.1 Two component regulator propeller [Chitinophaga costaii]
MPFKRFIGLCIFLMAGLVSRSYAQGILIRNYNVKDGLANATVYGAVQDKDGFIWFATPTGVSKFDGKRFRNYAKHDGLTDNDVLKLAADNQGRVWFFTGSTKLSYYSNNLVHNEQNDSSLYFPINQNPIQYAFDDGTVNTWFLNGGARVMRYNGRNTIYSSPGQTDLFFLLRNDTIFHPLQASFQLTGWNDPNNPFQQIQPNILNYTQPAGYALVHRKPAIVIGNKLFIYNHNQASCFFSGNDYGITDDIRSLYIDRDNLWIGTQKALYYLKDYFRGDTKLSRLLDNHYITSILGDRDGNFWISTFGDGVYNIPFKNFYFNYLDNTNGLATHSIFSIFKDQASGMLLIGQNAGYLNTLDRNGKISQYGLSGSLGGRNSIISMLPYGKDVLIGMDNGIYTFNLAKQKPELLRNVSRLKDIDVSPGGKIRVAAEDQLITLDDDIPPVLSAGGITSVACIDDSTYYVGTNTGLYFGTDWDSQLLSRWTDPRLKQSIRHLKNINGDLWIGTADQGLYVLHHDSVVSHISMRQDLASDICQQLYYDERGHLFVATDRGVSEIDVASRKIMRKFTSNDGLNSDDIRDVFLQDSMLYIATSNGLCYFRDKQLPVDTTPPTVYLSTIRYADVSYTASAKTFTHLFKSKSSFEVEFGAIAFDLPDLVEYQYNFSADSTDWISTKSNIIPYPDLQPGHYELVIRARKYNGAWSKPVSLDINILPRWYQQWWARGILVLLGILLIGFFLRYIIRRVKQSETRKTEYNRKIAELEAKALTNQMNPHFIFNSLNSVQHLILEKEEKQALNFLADFATLMRQMLNNSRKSYISLEDEIAFLTRYIELEKMRFANAFTYHFNLQPTLKEFTVYIPPMIIQPILENAIKHGLAPKTKAGYLEIRLELVDDMLYVSVDDDGIGWEKANSLKSGRLIKHESTALSVIRDRLQIIKSFNGNVGKLEIIDKFKSGLGSREGTLVEILIPIVKML